MNRQQRILLWLASALGFCSLHLEWLLPARVGQGIGAALATLLILVLKPKKAYICTPI